MQICPPLESVAKRRGTANSLVPRQRLVLRKFGSIHRALPSSLIFPQK